MFFYTFVGQLAEKVYLCTAFRIESGGAAASLCDGELINTI